MDKKEQKIINKKIFKRYLDTHYYVSSDGDIWSDKKFKILTQHTMINGYYTVMLYKSGYGNYKELVHRMVAICWIPNPLGLPEVNHKDINKSNNHDYNLEWCTHSDNIKHMASNIYNPIVNIGDRSKGTRAIMKPVGQYIGDTLIAKFDCITYAAIVIYGDRSDLSKSISNCKIYKGYEWRYL